MPAPDEPVYMGLPHERYLRPRFYVALVLTVPVLAMSMGAMLWPHAFHWLTAGVSGWLQLALAMTTAWGAWALARSLPHWPINVGLAPSAWFNFQMDLVRSLYVILPGAIASAITMAILSKRLRQVPDGRPVIVAGALLFMACMYQLAMLTMDSGKDDLFWPLVLSLGVRLRPMPAKDRRRG